MARGRWTVREGLAVGWGGEVGPRGGRDGLGAGVPGALFEDQVPPLSIGRPQAPGAMVGGWGGGGNGRGEKK